MYFPRLNYYSIAGLSKRWQLPKKQIRHYIETGRLGCCIWISTTLMEIGEFRLLEEGVECFHAITETWVKGFVRLLADDCRGLFRDGYLHTHCFESLEEERKVMQVKHRKETRLIDPKEVVILSPEIQAFEVQCSRITSDPDSPGHFTHSQNYQTIRLRGKEYRFGLVQAAIIRQLHEAYLKGEEWVYGKTLLHGAESESIQVKDVFRSQTNWREIIESDRKGYYRLKR